MTIHSLLLRCSYVVLAVSVASPATATSTSATAYAVIDTVGAQQHAASGGAAGAQTSAGLNADNVFVNAQGSAGLGSLHTSDSARATEVVDAQGQATAGVTDVFKTSAPALDGTVGTMTVSAFVDGRLDATVTGLAFADTRVVADIFLDDTGAGANDFSTEGSARHYLGFGVPDTRVGDASFELQMTIPFVFGQDMTLSMSLFSVSGISVHSSASAFAQADYGHTMRWGGITDVHDSAGHLVTGFTAIGTSSNFNYAVAAVPEPASGAMTAVGLLALCGLYRRRLRSSMAHPALRVPPTSM